MLFLHSFEAGGVERVALRLAGAWSDAGCDVIVAMGRKGGPLTAEAPPGPLFAFARPSAIAAHCESLWLVPHLISMVRRHRPDVLFCAGNTYAIVAVLARLVLGRRCPPIVCKVSNSLVRADFRRPMRWLYARWLWLQTLHIESFVGLAEPMRQELSRALSVPPSRIEIIPDPALRLCDIPAVPQEPRSTGPTAGRLFLGAGRLVPQKDFGLLLRAFAHMRQAGDQLVIVGDGRERVRLEHLARNLGITQHVQFPGHVFDIGPWLRRADAFVLSSRYEGVPAVVIEALAHGVPVAATDCSVSLDDLVGDGTHGEIVRGRDPKALAQAMRNVVSRAADVTAMRARARDFTVERAGPRYLRIMAELADAARAGDDRVRG